MTEPRPNKSIMRSLGEFLGHIVHAAKTEVPHAPPPPPPPPTAMRETVDEREATTADGRRVTVRRTVIEEIEVRPPENPRAS